jgi:hypothetical protein
MKSPKLRTVEKYQPPYPLNKFPEHFAVNLGREVIYLLASRGKDARLEGLDWEEIFARLIGGDANRMSLVKKFWRSGMNGLLESASCTDMSAQ